MRAMTFAYGTLSSELRSVGDGWPRGMWVAIQSSKKGGCAKVHAFSRKRISSPDTSTTGVSNPTIFEVMSLSQFPCHELCVWKTCIASE